MVVPRQFALLRQLWSSRVRRRASQTVLVTGLAAMLMAFITMAILLHRRSSGLESALRAELLASVDSVRGDVQSVFQRARDNVLILYNQRRVWTPPHASPADDTIRLPTVHDIGVKPIIAAFQAGEQ